MENIGTATVFYSWQSDLKSKTTRNLIEGCLNKAIQALGRDDEVEIDASLDRDTRGVTGAPVILDTILEKIDRAAAFVADVSIINAGTLGRPTPNPNVLVELGYAVKSLTWDCVLPVCNKFHGDISVLPFDIPDRRVMAYSLSDNPTEEELKSAKELLIGGFKIRLKEMFKRSVLPAASVDFGDLNTEELIGKSLKLQFVRTTFSDYPDNLFPKFSTPSRGSQLELASFAGNPNYYQECATYINFVNATRKVAFAITNHSDRAMIAPKLEIVINCEQSKVIAMDVHAFPSPPSKLANFQFGRSVFHKDPPNFAEVKRGEFRTIIRADLSNIQPKRTSWTTHVYLGPMGVSDLECTLFADNLPNPIKQNLRLDFVFEDESRTLNEWIELKIPSS